MKVPGFVKQRIGYWPCTPDSLSGAVYADRSGNKRHLTVTGSPSSQTGPWGIAATALGFTASEDLASPSTDALSGKTALSFAAWVRPTTILTSQYWFVGWGADNNNEWGFFIHPTQGLRARHVVGGSELNASWGYGGGEFGTGAWYHLALVYDGGQPSDADKYKLWVNGVARTMTVGAGMHTAMPTGTASIYLTGNRSGANDFLGYMAHVFLWSRALTAVEAAGLAALKF